jgi:uncharacterized protein (DUF1800 family)
MNSQLRRFAAFTAPLAVGWLWACADGGAPDGGSDGAEPTADAASSDDVTDAGSAPLDDTGNAGLDGDTQEAGQTDPDSVEDVDVGWTPSGFAGDDVSFDDFGEAARFLNMATFGATRADVERLMEIGLDRWFAEQLAMPECLHLDPALGEPGGNEQDLIRRVVLRRQIWFTNIMTCPAQLRQRVAFALSNLFVVSEQSVLLVHQDSLASYTELLERHSLGSFDELLYDVSRSAAMGSYLNMLGNSKAVPQLGIRPDENFAREVQQLFTIGLVELNLDGTPRLDSNGAPIPTYTQDGVEAFSRAFTGWSWDGVTTIAEAIAAGARPDLQDYVSPMSAVDELHDMEEKVLFAGTVLAPDQTAEQDLEQALQALVAHPNVAPFLSRQLIQRLVTSNPSPAYVERVASVFNDNGFGERGDMYAVVRAILADPEALSGQAPEPWEFGRLREPLVRVTHLWRSMDATAVDGEGDGYAFLYLTDQLDLGQAILASPTVFNFFFPDYSPPGAVSEAGLVAPEFQILNETYLARTTNAIGSMALLGYVGSPTAALLDGYVSARLDYSHAAGLLESGDGALLDYLDGILMGGTMPRDMRVIISQAITTARFAAIPTTQIVAEVVHLIVLSPQYVVQR